MSKNEIRIEFWGVRGTLPVPGKETVRYGGNTNCVFLKVAEKYLFIFDAGTGIKNLSDQLMKEKSTPLAANLFITHPHWDHINGLPFFAPFYEKNNFFSIFSAGEEKEEIEELIFGQMDSIHFPVARKALLAKLSFYPIQEGAFYLDSIEIRAIRLKHPGFCLGYRLCYQNKSVCYITDNELPFKNSAHFNQAEVDKLSEFIANTDILIIDATYTDEEYASKEHWGHSCISQVVELADKAAVKLICLYHHDPNQTDHDIDLKLKTAQSLLQSRHSKTQCIAPHEGDKLII